MDWPDIHSLTPFPYPFFRRKEKKNTKTEEKLGLDPPTVHEIKYWLEHMPGPTVSLVYFTVEHDFFNWLFLLMYNFFL